MATLQTNFPSSQKFVDIVEETQAYSAQVEDLTAQFASQFDLLTESGGAGWTKVEHTSTLILYTYDDLSITVEVHGTNLNRASPTITSLLFDSPSGRFEVLGSLQLNLLTLSLTGSITSVSGALGDVSTTLTGNWDIASGSVRFDTWSYMVPTSYGATSQTYHGAFSMDVNGNVEVESISGYDLAAANGKSLAYTGTGLTLYSSTSVYDTLKAALSGNDQITGAEGNESLDGFAGNDLMKGNAGNDTLNGGKGADTLQGGNGADRLIGGAGNDSLTGGGGADKFRFNSTSEKKDSITDFVSGSDKIQVVSKNFGNLAVGTLAAANFKAAGTTLTNANPVFLYNSATGALSFDSDGNGSAAAVQIAVLTVNKTLAASDIQVVS